MCEVQIYLVIMDYGIILHKKNVKKTPKKPTLPIFFSNMLP